ncbi:MAG: T9SS type A sorting domain-containing protein, partial [Cyclobacteriaceae bacterium]|nr:T9SS type A sorting domain-containing protein [Cyclobacteriaceae bacterium]
ALPVPGSLLPSGNNVLKVRVNGVCGIDYLEENWVINRYPDAVISVEKGEVLVSNYDSGNQWYYNNELIPGAVDKTYKPSESGIYGLVVAHETCSSITEIKFSITGLEDVQEFMSVFPNPFRNSIHIKGLSPDTSEERAIIINSMGQLMGQFEIKYDPINNSGYLNLDELADGFYIIKIKSKDTYLSYPIIKDSKI